MSILETAVETGLSEVLFRGWVGNGLRALSPEDAVSRRLEAIRRRER